ncbi:18166_t:CDS:2, partial [Gigaspora margarita]
SFDHIISQQLDPVWHRVEQKTKLLIGEQYYESFSQTQKNIVESDDDNGNSNGLLAEIVNEIELEIKSLLGLPSSDEKKLEDETGLYCDDCYKLFKWEDSVQSKGDPESSSKKVISSESKKQYQHGQQSSNKRRHIHKKSVAVAASPTRTTVLMAVYKLKKKQVHV